jgi:hypothetical protein
MSLLVVFLLSTRLAADGEDRLEFVEMQVARDLPSALGSNL